jgi:hypothetical protein
LSGHCQVERYFLCTIFLYWIFLLHFWLLSDHAQMA